MFRKFILPIVVASSLLFLACWSHKEQFHTTLVNGSGGALHSIEVDYPGGTYGIASLAAGASYQKWIFAKGVCKYSVRFVDERGKEYSPKELEISTGSCPQGVTLTIDSSMSVTGAATAP